MSIQEKPTPANQEPADMPRWEAMQSKLTNKQEATQVRRVLNNTLMFLVRNAAENFVKGVDFKKEAGFDEGLIDAFNKGLTPLVMPSHDSWANGVSLIRIAGEMTSILQSSDREFNGLLTSLASSFATGDQRIMLGRIYRELKPMYEKYNFHTNVHTRPEDKPYEIPANRSDYTGSITEGASADMAIAVLGEGHVTGGRFVDPEPSFFQLIRYGLHRPVYGLQELNPLSLSTTLSAIHRAGKEAYIIPAAVWGDNNIIQADKIGKPGGHITLRAVGAGIGSLFKLPLAHFSHVRLGVGMHEDELDRLKDAYPDLKPRDARNEVLSRQIAKRLPPERRGKFKDKV